MIRDVPSAKPTSKTSMSGRNKHKQEIDYPHLINLRRTGAGNSKATVPRQIRAYAETRQRVVFCSETVGRACYVPMAMRADTVSHPFVHTMGSPVAAHVGA